MSTRPVFLGGTLAEHKMFVLSLCRYQHVNTVMSLLHWATWSIGHVSLFVIAEKAFGMTGGIAWAVFLTLWSSRIDLRVGAAFAFVYAFYAFLGSIVVDLPAVAELSVAATVGYGLLGVVAGFLLEVVLHLIFQGAPPKPPSTAITGAKPIHQILFVPYFAIFFGLFFLNLDLAMRFLGYEPESNRRATELSVQWRRQVDASEKKA